MLIDVEGYRLYLIENEIANNTIKNYMNTLKSLNKYLVDNNIEELDKSIIVDYKEYLRNKEYKKDKKYTLKTLKQSITALNVYFNWAKRTDLKVKNIKVQGNTHRESISDTDYKQLIKAADIEMQMFMSTIANTGVRIAELLQLKKKDLYKSVIEIENKGKTRIIALNPSLKKALKSFSKELEDDDYIFIKSADTYRYRLKQLAAKAKIKKAKVYPHSFRHYFAKKYIENGGDSTTLQQMLGHSNISTTTIYTQLSQEELADRFKRVNNM